MSITLFVHAAAIITVDCHARVILDGAVLVSGSKIKDIGKSKDLLLRHGPSVTAINDISGKIVIPGLINAHAHLAQSLLRGLAEDLPLHSWLCDAIWPLEASYQGDDSVIAGKLTMAEMLKSGTTSFLEALLPAQTDVAAVCEAVGQMGIRCCLVRQKLGPRRNLLG